LTNQDHFWLCNSEPKQKNHSSHDQTDNIRDHRLGIHWRDCIWANEIQSRPLGFTHANADANATHSGAKNAARTTRPKADGRAKSNCDAESGEINARAKNDSGADADENDADTHTDTGETNALAQSRIDAAAGAFAANDVDSNSA
jgi:hypothetical protein